MTATATTAPRVEQISAEGVTDLSTRTQQMRFLIAEGVCVSRQQAAALIRAYEHAKSDAHRIGNDTGRSDSDFLDWLLRQAPGGKRTTVKKREWRCAS